MRFAFLLAPAVALILVAGCSGSGGHPASTPSATAVPTSPATTSASATPSPTATTPLLTGAAVKPGEVPPTEDPHFIIDDIGGAIGFASYFYEALDWSIATTNANLLRPISASTCKACQRYIQEIDALSSTGGHSEGARLSAVKFAPAHGDLVQATYVVQVTITQDAQVIVGADGSRTSVAPPSPNPNINYLYVSWGEGSFVAVGIGG